MQKRYNSLDSYSCLKTGSENTEITRCHNEILNQTDDFSNGCTPFKVAASKAVDMQRKRDRKKVANKDKLSRERKVIFSEKTFSEPKLECSDSTKCASSSKVCEICKSQIPALEHGNHMKQCLKKKYSRITKQDDSSSQKLKKSPYWDDDSETHISAFCEFCKKNIEELSAFERITHKNQCVDQNVFEKELQKKIAAACEKAKKQVLDCPICGQGFKTLNSRKNHLKKCAVKYDISTNVLMERVKFQEEEHHKKIKEGHIPVDLDEEVKPAKKVKKTKTSGKKQSQNDKKFEEDTHLALALSSSMYIVDSPHKNVNIPIQEGSKDAFSILMTPKKKEKESRRKRNKQKICLEKLPLLIQTEEEMYKKLEKKVNAVMLSQEHEYKYPLTPQFKGSLLPEKSYVMSELDKHNKTVTLWEKTAMKSICETDHHDLYYVHVLMPPLTFCEVKAGSKLKHMSNIAGWQSSDLSLCEKKLGTDHVSSKSVSFLHDTTTVPSTQTAIMLAELAQDHCLWHGHQDKTYFLNQTGFFGESSEINADDPKKVNCAEEEKALVSDFSNMVDNVIASDMVIIADGDQIINAHKFVLAARCTKMLQCVENDKLQLSQFRYQSVLVLMKYLYAGICDFQSYLAFEIKELAQRYSLNNLLVISNSVIQEMDTSRTSQNQKHCQNPDKTLQNILKEAWGSDSDEDSEDISNERRDIECTNENKSYKSEDEWEELYEFMTSQRRESNNKKLSIIEEDNSENAEESFEVFSDNSDHVFVPKIHVSIDDNQPNKTENTDPNDCEKKLRNLSESKFIIDTGNNFHQLELQKDMSSLTESLKEQVLSKPYIQDNEDFIKTSYTDKFTNSQISNTSKSSDILGSRANENDIIAIFNDISSSTDLKSQIPSHYQNHQMDLDNEQSKIKTALKDASTMKKKSPFKDDYSMDKSIIDRSCEELFDSFSDGPLSHVSTPGNIKFSALGTNVTKHTIVIETRNCSLNSTPSPVFEKQAKTSKNESFSTKRNLCSKFNVTNNKDSTIETDFKTHDNFTNRKRKRNDSNCDSITKPSQKQKKQNIVSARKELYPDELNMLSEGDVHSNTIISNCSNIQCDSPSKHGKTNTRLQSNKCIDLTLSDDSQGSEKDSTVNNEAHDGSLSNNDNIHSSQEDPELNKVQAYGNSTPHKDVTVSPNQEDVWDDFQDNGFDQEFNDANPYIIKDNEIIASNTTIGSSRFDIELDDSLLSLSKKEKINNSILHQDNDMSMYDPPTDISTNISEVFNTEDESFLIESTSQEEQVTPKATPVLPKTRKKSLSKWIPPSPFTPMPNYDDMNTPQLQRQIKNMGVRILPKKKMVTLLKNIYQESHAYETDPEFDSNHVKDVNKKYNEISSVNDPSSSKTTKNVKGKSRLKEKCSKKSSKNTTGVETKKKSKATNLNAVLSLSSSENESVSCEDIPEETIVESSQEPKLSKRDVEYKRKQLWDSITADSDLMLKILHYETIDLEDFQHQLKIKGIKNIGTNVISEFLDDKTIPFTNRSQNKASYGRKKTKKREHAKESTR